MASDRVTARSTGCRWVEDGNAFAGHDRPVALLEIGDPSVKGASASASEPTKSRPRHSRWPAAALPGDDHQVVVAVRR